MNRSKKNQFPLKSSNSLQSGRSAMSEHSHSSSVRPFELIDSVGGKDTFARTVQCLSTCHRWANWFTHSISKKKNDSRFIIVFLFYNKTSVFLSKHNTFRYFNCNQSWFYFSNPIEVFECHASLTLIFVLYNAKYDWL